MINITPIIRTAPPPPAIIMISLRSSTESVLSCVGGLVVNSPVVGHGTQLFACVYI